jgi:hypothetical protein
MLRFKTLCTNVSGYSHMLYLKLYNICIYSDTMVHNV